MNTKSPKPRKAKKAPPPRRKPAQRKRTLLGLPMYDGFGMTNGGSVEGRFPSSANGTADLSAGGTNSFRYISFHFRNAPNLRLKYRVKSYNNGTGAYVDEPNRAPEEESGHIYALMMTLDGPDAPNFSIEYETFTSYFNQPTTTSNGRVRGGQWSWNPGADISKSWLSRIIVYVDRI